MTKFNAYYTLKVTNQKGEVYCLTFLEEEMQVDAHRKAIAKGFTTDYDPCWNHGLKINRTAKDNDDILACI